MGGKTIFSKKGSRTNVLNPIPSPITAPKDSNATKIAVGIPVEGTIVASSILSRKVCRRGVKVCTWLIIFPISVHFSSSVRSWACDSAFGICSTSALIPSPVIETVGTTGTSSSSSSFSTSIVTPLCLASSQRLSATTIGTSCSSNSRVRCKLRSRCVASTTLITTSPSLSMSTATSSALLVGSRVYDPGTSIISALRLPNVKVPFLNSTVVPG